MMDQTPHHRIDVAHNGVTTGILLVITGMIGWDCTLLTQANSSRSSDQ